MSGDSNFSQISSSAKPAPQGKGFTGGQVVQIIKLPDTLTNLSHATRIEGQVSEVRRDGVVRILTDKGDIDVQVKGRNQPQPGQQLEIEIPAGREPRKATLREPPSRPTQISQPPAQTAQPTVSTTRPITYSPPPQQASNTPQQQAQVTAPPPNQYQQYTQQQQVNTAQSTQANPANIQTTQNNNAVTQNPLTQLGNTNNTQTTLTPPTQQNPPVTQNTASVLTPDSSVRLLGVSPAQANTIAQDTIDKLITQNVSIPRIAFTANLITNNISDSAVKTLLSSVQGSTPVFTLNKSVLVPQSPTQTITPIITGTSLTTPVSTQTSPVPTPAILIANNTAQAFPVAMGNTTLPLTPQPQAVTLQPVNILQSFESNSFLQTTPSITNSNTLPVTANLPISSTQSIFSNILTQTSSPAIQNTNIQTTLTPAPLTTGISPNASTVSPSLRIDKIDVQIVKITPPEVTLLPSSLKQNEIAIPAKTVFLPNIISPNNATTITAKVTGFTPEGLPLVTLKLPGSGLPQSFTLQFNSTNLKLGTQLQLSGFQIPSSAQVTATANAVTPTNTTLPPLFQGFQWPAIEELYQTLLQSNPQAAQSLSTLLPNAATPGRMGPAAMMFIAAVRAGDLGGWMGDKKIDLLQRAGRGNLLSQITREIANTSRTVVQESTSSEWRAVPLPMFWEGEIQKIMLFTKHENRQDHNDNEKDQQTRFIFDLNLSRMGDVQLDGLLREKRLDLMVRTQNMMSQPMQETMRKAYLSALSHTSMTGEINFQGDKNHWVHVLEEKEKLGVSV